ncbi:unnamed protein product, partial [Adineta ricciae]
MLDYPVFAQHQRLDTATTLSNRDLRCRTTGWSYVVVVSMSQVDAVDVSDAPHERLTTSWQMHSPTS